MTVVPVEAVKDSEFTGETTVFNGIIDGEYMGKMANKTIKIRTDCFHRKAVTIPGEKIAWTAAICLDMVDTEELPRVLHQIQLTNQLPEEDTHFLPPRMEDGMQSG